MALRDITNELTIIPKMSGIFAQTLADRSLQKIYDESSWSFQMGESGWLAPNLIDAGTVTLTVGSDQVVGDATAAAAWLAISGLPLITQRQFRLSVIAPGRCSRSGVCFLSHARSGSATRFGGCTAPAWEDRRF